MVVKYYIYKIVNKVNNRYYIGRHATTNINDGYMGSGKAIINAINKYGKDNFEKHIIAEAFSREDLWELEKQIVDKSVVDDPASYNMTYGGKGYLDGLKKSDFEAFIRHQSTAGALGGISCYYQHKTKQERKEWHSLGGKAAATKNKKSITHPFYTGVAASLGGKAVKGMVELWSPASQATNKNQPVYKPGDSKKARLDSEKYGLLVAQGWMPIKDHVKRILNSGDKNVF